MSKNNNVEQALNSNNYNEAVKLLTSSGKFRISLGLERIEKILNLLNNPQDKLNCIHVAGTNGKGSVCAILASILNCAEKKVGLYSSPHIFKYTERIKTGNIFKCHSDYIKNDYYCLPKKYTGNVYNELVNISDEDFANYVFEISKLAENNGIDLTEFEILTAVMFKYFADKNVDIVVLETGLGGRFDATNIIKKNICSVITHVDYDHTERLGNTLDEIAFEKAGIIKPNCPCIVLEGKEVYYNRAKDIGSVIEIIRPFTNGSDFALKGCFQNENLSLALAVIEQFFPEITQAQIDKGIKKVKHPCRFQFIKEKNLIIDGAHNPNGIDALVKSLDAYYPYSKRRFIFGCLKNKDYKKMLSNLLNNDDEIYFYKFNNENSATFEQLQTFCPIKPKELKNPEQIDFNEKKLNIICGSFYMIADLVKFFNLTV